MELTKTDYEWLDKLLFKMPSKKEFNFYTIIKESQLFPTNQNNLMGEDPAIYSLSKRLTTFLLDNEFADDMSNPFIYQYVEGQKMNEFGLKLSDAGIRLKKSGSYQQYLKDVESEEKSRRCEKRKNNVNLIFSILAAIASIIALGITVFS